MDVLQHRPQMETDLTDHTINDKYQKAVAQSLMEWWTENS